MTFLPKFFVGAFMDGSRNVSKLIYRSKILQTSIVWLCKSDSEAKQPWCELLLLTRRLGSKILIVFQVQVKQKEWMLSLPWEDHLDLISLDLQPNLDYPPWQRKHRLNSCSIRSMMLCSIKPVVLSGTGRNSEPRPKKDLVFLGADRIGLWRKVTKDNVLRFRENWSLSMS
jgi:hypothetical protein